MESLDRPGTHRVALVTGAARGIGAATVVALAAEGWRVVAVDRCTDDGALPYPLGTRAGLQQTAVAANAAAGTQAPATGGGRRDGAGTQAPATGGGRRDGAGTTQGPPTGGGRRAETVIAMAADTRDPGSLAAAVAEAERRWGGLDAAVAAAGVIAGGVPAWQVPPDAEQALLDTNLGGVLNLARVAVPALLRRPVPRRGRFLAVASAAATRGLPMLAAYCASKAAVGGFVRALAAELGGTGITANAVSPGSTDTPMLAESARLYGLPAAAAFARQQPIGRLLDPAEVAAVIAFLVSERADAVTGATVPADGGLAL